MQAQLPAIAWAKSFPGSGTVIASGRAVAVDASGNVYTAGSFQGTVDFDPGAGTYTLASNGVAVDVFVSKLDAAGNFVWAKSFGSTSADYAYSIVLDIYGNIFVSGSFSGSGVDFDPGAGFTNVTSNGRDAFAWKLTSAGNYADTYVFGGSGTDEAQTLSADASGNVYIAGYVQSIADLDPSASVLNYTAAGGNDIFMVKMGPGGVFVWAKGFGGTGNEIPNGMAVDASGNNVYITGAYESTCDFDPTAAVSNLTSTGLSDAFIAKYSNAGAALWAKSIGGSVGNDEGRGVILEPGGNIYATGNFSGNVDLDPNASVISATSAGGTDFYIVKLDPTGTTTLWGKAMGGTLSDYVYGLALDSNGDIYTCGAYGNVVDFDPGPGVSNLSVNGNADLFISKLTAASGFGWAKSIGGPLAETAYGIAVDASKNVYTTGIFASLTDFDPNAGTYNLTTAGTTDVFVHKMGICPTLTVVPTQTNVLCNGYATGAASVAVTGGSSFTYSWIPGGNTTPSRTGLATGTYSCISTNDCYNASTTIFTIIQPSTPPSNGFPNSQTICSGQTATLTMVASGGTPGYTYSWTGPNLSSNNTAGTVASPLSSTTYTYSVTDANACVATNTLMVTVSALPPVVVSPSPGSICPGGSSTISATGAITYSWNTGATTNTITVSPASTSAYTVTGTGANGCVATATTSVILNPNPVASATTSTPACIGGNLNFTNTSTGATTYTWTGPSSYSSTITNPVITGLSVTSSGNYTLNARSAAGCTNTAVIPVTVNALPSLTVSANTNSVCSGTTFTANSTGAITYTWMPGTLYGASQTFTPSSTIAYTVSGTNAAGCVGNSTLGINVNALTAITGTATNSSNPVAGTAILYRYKPFLTKFDSITTQTLNGSGAYSFTAVPAGDYIVKAVPSTTTLQVTYGTGAISWKNALVINHGCITNNIQNINVASFTPVGTGPGSLSGVITQTVGFGHRPGSINSPLAPGQPIGGIVVKGGKNPGGNMFTQTTTASDGTYTLSGLPTNGDDYFILVDIPGLDTNGTYHRKLTSTNQQFTGLNFTVDSIFVNPVNTTVTGIAQLHADADVIQIYPNPAKNKITIYYSLPNSSAVSITMTDLVGKTVKNILPLTEQDAGTYQPVFSLDGLNPGMYFIKLRTNDRDTALRLIITN